MIFPRPVSAKTRARLSLARIISDLGDLYGSEISGFELEIGVQVKGQDIKARQERYRGQFLKIFVSPILHKISIAQGAKDTGSISSYITTDGIRKVRTGHARSMAREAIWKISRMFGTNHQFPSTFIGGLWTHGSNLGQKASRECGYITPLFCMFFLPCSSIGVGK